MLNPLRIALIRNERTITISLGVATIHLRKQNITKNVIDTVEKQLKNEADKLLYLAKSEGRNCIRGTEFSFLE